MISNMIVATRTNSKRYIEKKPESFFSLSMPENLDIM